MRRELRAWVCGPQPILAFFPPPPCSALLTSLHPDICFSNPCLNPCVRRAWVLGNLRETSGASPSCAGVPYWECRVGEMLLFCNKFHLPWKFWHLGPTAPSTFAGW